MNKATRLCGVAGCERKHSARGLCSMHWKREHGKRTMYEIACATCGAETRGVRQDNGQRFCSLICRDLWRVEQADDPMWQLQRSCRLPADHPVRQLIRERAQQPGPIRAALEAGDWPALLDELEQRSVKVDDCWLWPRGDKSGYGRVAVAGRSYGAHRLAAMSARGEHIPSYMPVHHVCAEPLCINPLHLQVVTPHENAAEMLERRHYQERIAELEAALRSVAPEHPALAPGHPLRLAS